MIYARQVGDRVLGGIFQQQPAVFLLCIYIYYIYFSGGSIQTLNDIKMIFNRSHDMKGIHLDFGAAFIYFCLD